MPFRIRPRHPHPGFLFAAKNPAHSQSGSAATLVAIVMVLTIGGIMLAVHMAGKQGSDYNEKVRETQRRFNFIHERIRLKMAETGKLPRPANSTYPIPDPANPQEDTNYFGIESVPSADVDPTHLPKVYIGPDITTGKVLRGDVPLVTLNIDDPKYMFDAWGNRFVYEVQENATEDSDCRTLQEDAAKDPLKALVDIHDYSGSTKERVFYALMSMGPDGHLAVPAQGAEKDSRKSTGNTDADTLINGVPDTTKFKNILVQKARTSTFDDMISYSTAYKHTCCLMPSCLATSDPQPGFKFTGVDASDLSGWDVAIGDVNGDTVGDLVIGSPYENTVYVIFGSINGFPSPLPLDSLDGTNGFKIVNPGGDLFGWSVHAGGDVNGDGLVDIAIGNPNSLTEQFSCPRPPANLAYIVFGRTTWPAVMTFTNVGGTWGPTGTSGFGFGAPSMPPNFGYDVLIADVNKDNIVDFCVSSLNDVNCMYGHAGSFPINPSYVDATTLVGATTGFRITADANDTDDPDRPVAPTGSQNFAPSLAAGDINNDGTRDLVIGAAQITPPAPNDHPHAGGVYVVFGRTNWPNELFLGSLTGSNGFRIDGAVDGSKMGSAVASGDINGDGTDDVIAGATHAMLKLTYNSTGAVFCCTTVPGKVYVIYGASGTWPEYMNVNTLNGTNGFMISGASNNDNFGMSLAVTDVDGDGVDDIIAGAPTEGGTGEGAAYVIYGKSVFPSVMDVTTPDGTNVSRTYGIYTGEYAGWAVAGGNINGADGGDFAVTTPFTDFGGGSQSGGGYIVFGPMGSVNVDLENM